MADIPGVRPPDLSELVRVQDRMTFLYLERCTVHRDASAITATDERGTVHIPAAAMSALLFGPGVRVTHSAMMLLAESGSTAVWVGERGVRYYAHGRSLARSSRLLMAQAELVTNRSSRLRVARDMYAMRFPGEDTSGLTMQQLRGREGARVRRCYRESAQLYGIDWSSRRYKPDDFDAADPVNQALSAATTALYGLTHAVIVGLGCSPGLGFVHTGHVRSFVFDIADLYKAEYAIPCAFEIAAGGFQDVGAETRRAMRDRFRDGSLLETCARDVRGLLLPDGPDADEDADIVSLWDGGDRVVAGGTAYGGAGLVTVIVLTACPEKLRGYLTRWLLEISAGVFVGSVSRRVRDELWDRVGELVGRGRGILVFSAPNEQHLEIRTCGHDWVPVDAEGITLMRRPVEPGQSIPEAGSRTDWSAASGRRRGAGRGRK